MYISPSPFSLITFWNSYRFTESCPESYREVLPALGAGSAGSLLHRCGTASTPGIRHWCSPRTRTRCISDNAPAGVDGEYIVLCNLTTQTPRNLKMGPNDYKHSLHTALSTLLACSVYECLPTVSPADCVFRYVCICPEQWHLYGVDVWSNDLGCKTSAEHRCENPCGGPRFIYRHWALRIRRPYCDQCGELHSRLTADLTPL